MLYQESRRLGRKTTLGFIGLAVIIVAQMTLSAWSLHRMYKEMSNTLISLSDLQLESLELKAQIGDVRRFEKDILISGEGAAEERRQAYLRWQESIQKSYAQIERLKKEAMESTGHVPVGTEELSTLLAKYAKGIDTITQHLGPPGGLTPYEAKEAIAPIKQLAYEMIEQLDKIVDDAESHEQEALRRLAEQRTLLFGTLALIGLLSLLVSGVLSINVTRGSLAISRSLEHQALHDTLTGLLNRRGLAASMNADSARGGALAYIDLDRFKLINDLCGHTAGDDLLVELTEKIAACCTRHRAAIARVGGDEFAVWLGGDQDLEAAHRLGEELVHLVETHNFSWLGQPMPLGASVGLALAAPGFLNREVVARADAACRLAKLPGSAKILIYEEADPAIVKARQEERWAARLPQLIREGRFRLYGQRVVALQPGENHGHIEILLRGIDDEGQIVAPGAFLSAAERFGLMPKLDRWVVETVLASPLDPGCKYAINLSGQTLMDKDYLPQLEALLRASGKAHQISFEITESAAMSSVDTAREYIRRLKLLGCRFALDDFGSGFSSFAYLRDLRVDFLKIDGSLVRILGRDAADAALLRAIVQMAQTLGLATIAEFVETPEIAAQLAHMGVNYGQGYGLHRPEPLEALTPRRNGEQFDPSI